MTYRLLPACLFSFALALLVACAPVRPQTPEQLNYPELTFQLPEVEPLVLDNGIRLYLKEDNELPLVQMTAMIGSGAITTPREKKGFADLFGMTWRTGGAGERTAEELDEYLDQLAANLGASMGPYSAQLDMSLRSDDLDTGVAVIADMLRRPVFAEARLELARLQALEALRRQNDNPGSISRRLLLQALYPDHYLGYPKTKNSIRNVTRQDLVDFHQSYFAPDNLWIAVSGDFDRESLITLLDKELGNWAWCDVPEQPLRAVAEPTKGAIKVAAKDLPQTTIMIGELGMTKDNPDQYAARVLNFILGGGSFNSRMMREIRSDRGLAYAAYSYFQIGRRLPGPFVASTETKTESVAEALRLTREIMQELRDNPVSAEELKLAKESQVNSFVFGFENAHSVVTRRMSHDFYNYPKNYLSSYRDNIAAVTIEDVQRVAQLYLDLSRQQIILVGDADEFVDQLTGIGLPIKEVDLTKEEGD